MTRYDVQWRTEAIERLKTAQPGMNFVDKVDFLGLDPTKHFRFMDLSGTDLSTCSLGRFDFTGARLVGCRLPKGHLRGAIFKSIVIDQVFWPTASRSPIQLSTLMESYGGCLPLAAAAQARRLTRAEAATNRLVRGELRDLFFKASSSSHLNTGDVFIDDFFAPPMFIYKGAKELKAISWNVITIEDIQVFLLSEKARPAIGKIEPTPWGIASAYCRWLCALTDQRYRLAIASDFVEVFRPTTTEVTLDRNDAGELVEIQSLPFDSWPAIVDPRIGAGALLQSGIFRPFGIDEVSQDGIRHRIVGPRKPSSVRRLRKTKRLHFRVVREL